MQELKEAPHQNRVFVDSMPEFAAPSAGLVDFSEIDAILIGSYNTMLALPFITEDEKSGFKGMIFVTEPTLHFGRLFMEETIEYLERSSKTISAARWKDIAKSLPPPLCDAQTPPATPFPTCTHPCKPKLTTK